MTQPRAPLAGYGLFAGVLSAAGLPIYIHAPKVYVDVYGVGLASMGLLLLGLRLFDVVQDPILGRIAARLGAWRGAAVGLAVAIMGVSMLGLFAVTPPVAPLLWLGLTLSGVFTAFSFLTIMFYSQGVTRGDSMGEGGHIRLARWRETGALLGVCIASVAPTALVALGLPEYAGFAVLFAVAAAAAWLAMRREWTVAPAQAEPVPFATILSDPVARRLLIIALLNAAPVAVSATLFLYFVESRLAAPGWEGPLLLLFFLAAAAAAPGWTSAAERFGARRMLLAAMVLSIVAFGFALGLGAGDTWAFAAICLASGAALGADMTLLPALFSRRMAEVAPNAASGFGLWSFMSKFSLAIAAAALLPTLDRVGFVPGGANDPAALVWLSVLYAGVPCVLKLAAIAALAAMPEGAGHARHQPA